MTPRAPSRHTAGYSGTPLARKLGIKEGSRLGPRVDVAHVFVTERHDLARILPVLRTQLGPAAALWISWPKQSSRVPSTITEDTIRELALPLGFVDVRVSAVTDVWSGLKLVVRKALR